MKLSIIAEATLEQIKNRIPIFTQKYKLTTQDIGLLSSIIEPDPTPGKYSEWLIKNYKIGTIRVPEDNDQLNNNLKTFDKKKSKLQNQDIISYTPDSLAKALDDVLALTKSERKAVRRGSLQLPPGVRIVFEEGDLTVVEITTPEASSLLCSGTKWCVANREKAEVYLKDGPLYLLYKNGIREYLVHYESHQFKDINEIEVEPKIRFKYLSLMKPLLSRFYKSNWAVEYAKDVIKGRWTEAEPYIMKNPNLAYYYAKDVIKGRWTEAEPYIMKNRAVEYAKDVIKGRWPEAESHIIKNPSLAYYYANDVINGRWTEAEPYIMKNPYWAFHYALGFIEGRWPEAEPYIMKDPNSAYEYALYVIKGRWPEAESHIMKDPNSALNYAVSVIKGRWPEAEPYIMKDPKCAYYYAKGIINERWPEAEQYIMKDPTWAPGYKQFLRDLTLWRT